MCNFLWQEKGCFSCKNPEMLEWEFLWSPFVAAITQIDSVRISPLAGPWLALRALVSFFCLFTFLFVPLKSSSSINICRGPLGSNMPLLHLLLTSADVVVPLPLGLNRVIIHCFQRLPPASLQAVSDPTSLFCYMVLPHDLTFPALCSGGKCESHTLILNSSSATF